MCNEKNRRRRERESDVLYSLINARSFLFVLSERNRRQESEKKRMKLEIIVIREEIDVD